LFQIIIPNIIFVFALALLTAYLTFLTTKGSLTNNTYSNTWKKLTIRRKIVLFILTIIMLILLGQEINNQTLTRQKENKLNQEIRDRTSIIDKGIRSGVDSLSKQNLILKITIDTLNSNSEKQKAKIIELYKQNTDLAIQLSKSSKKLALPLPNELKVTGLSLTFKSEGLKKFLPELRKKLGLKNKEGVWMLSGSEIGFQLHDGLYSKEFQDLFDEKRLVINLNMADDIYLRESHYKNTDLHWNFHTKMSLNNKNSSFSYNVIKSSGEEYFNLSLRNASLGRPEQLSQIRVFNGLSSAADLCDKKVWIFIVVGGNGSGNSGTEFRAPLVSINRLTLRDNNNKDYEVEIKGFRTYKDDVMVKKFPEHDKSNFEYTYISGIFKCKSF